MVRVYTIAAPDEWGIRTGLERELAQSDIIKLISRNFSPERSFKDQLIEKLTLADIIIVIFTKQLKEREDLNTILEFLKGNYAEKTIIPISCKGDLKQEDFLEPLNTLVGIEMNPASQDSLIVTARQIETLAFRQNQKNIIEEVAENISEKSADFVKDTKYRLEKQENKLKLIAYFCFGIGLLSIIWAAWLVTEFSKDAIEHYHYTDNISTPKSATTTIAIDWGYIVLMSIRSFLIALIALAASKYCFIMGKAYITESLKNSNRNHAIEFGHFYMQVFRKGIEPKDLKDVFSNWNIEGTSAFSGSTSNDYDPKIFEKVLEVTKILKDGINK